MLINPSSTLLGWRSVATSMYAVHTRYPLHRGRVPSGNNSLELFARICPAVPLLNGRDDGTTREAIHLLSRAAEAEAHISQSSAGWEAYVGSACVLAHDVATCLAARVARRVDSGILG